MNELMVCRDCGESSDILKQRNDDCAEKDCVADVVDDDDDFGDDADDDATTYPLLAAINEQPADLSSPACLATMPMQRQRAATATVAAIDTAAKTVPPAAAPSTTLLNVRSELEMLGGSQARNALINAAIDQENNQKTNKPAAQTMKPQVSVDLELEIGGDVSAGMTASGGVSGGGGCEADGYSSSTKDQQRQPDRDCTPASGDSIRVHGTEEQPAVQTQIYARAASDSGLIIGSGGGGGSDPTATADAVTAGLAECTLRRRPGHARRQSADTRTDSNNGNADCNEAPSSAATPQSGSDGCCTLPRVRRAHSVATANPVLNSGGAQNGGGANRRQRKMPPMRTTPDGTNIYYWCEMSKRAQKGANNCDSFLRNFNVAQMYWHFGAFIKNMRIISLRFII